METNFPEKESEFLTPGVFAIPEEPAIVINGVPDLPIYDETPILCKTTCSATDTKLKTNTGFGTWLEGREVRKLFGDQFYLGIVTEFDKEAGWYRVVYEDGDLEDLDWNELEGVLLPLDITIPLKSLASKIIKKSQKPVHKSGKASARYKNRRTKNVERKGNTTQAPEEIPLAGQMPKANEQSSEKAEYLSTNGKATERISDIGDGLVEVPLLNLGL